MEKFALILQASDSPKTRIRDHVRGLILSGELGAGEKLPSMPVLARMWKTHVPTVHAAFQDLHREGLTIPRQGKGIFVAERKRKLDNVAIYTTVEALSDPTMWFRRSVVTEVSNTLRASGATARTWVDPRPHEERDQTFRELEDLARRGEIQGLIMLAIKPEYAAWTQTLPIATSCIGSFALPTSVRSDQRTMIDLAVARLAEQGCRSIGMIVSYRPGQEDPEKDALGKRAPVMLQALIDAAGRHGLELRNSWIRMPEPGRSVRNYDQAEFAYREFHALWSQDQRPDGLIVDPDTGVEGAITAILERRVNIPHDLKVVFHRNENHRFICPFPASFVTTSEREYAEALVKQLERQLNGEPYQSIFIPYRLSNELPHRLVRRIFFLIPKRNPLNTLSMKRRSHLSLVAACGFALSASALHAQLFWYPQEGSNTWQNGGAANWRPNTDGSGTPTAWANSPLAEATFNSPASTVSVSGQVETSYLTIATAGYTFNGGTILINSGISNNAFRSTATTGSLTINSALDFRRTSSGLVNVNSSGTDVTFAAINGVTANNIANIDFNQAGETSRMDFNGTITATVMRFGISGNGGASYYLNTANAIATRSEVARGTVYVSHNDALGGGTRGLQLGNNDSGTNTVALLINGAYSLSNPITLSGREGTTNKRILGGSTANESSFTGNIALSRTSPVRVNNLEVTAALGGRVDFSGVISGTNNGATELAYVTKSGLGTVRFTNAAGNTYEGGTTISTGALLAMNTDSATSATGTGAVRVEDGGTLGGTGYVSGLVSTTGVAGTGRFAPGDANAIGRLNLQGGLTVANGAIFDIQLNGSSSDQINFGSGNLSLDGDIVFNLSTTLGGTVLTGNPYTIFLTTSGTPGSWILGGNLAFLFNAPSGYALDGSYGSGGYLWDATSRSLSVQLVPEPSTWLLLSAAGMALVLMRRRRCAH